MTDAKIRELIRTSPEVAYRILQELWKCPLALPWEQGFTPSYREGRPPQEWWNRRDMSGNVVVQLAPRPDYIVGRTYLRKHHLMEDCQHLLTGGEFGAVFTSYSSLSEGMSDLDARLSQAGWILVPEGV